MLATYDAQAIAEVMGLGAEYAPQPVSGGQQFGRREIPYAGFAEEQASFISADGSAMSAMAIEAAVEDGLPRQALRHVAEWLAGNDPAKVPGFEWAVVPKTTLERRTGKLSVPESERTERIARLAVLARQALGSDDEAREFLTAPHPELQGRSPFEAAKTDLGARRVEHLLTALEYGLAL